MKTFLLALLLMAASLTAQQPKCKVSVFDLKKVPDDLTGCGNAYYLTQQDKKASRGICWTDLVTAYIYINGKPIRLKSVASPNAPGTYKAGPYTLTITDYNSKRVDDEYYTMKARLTLKQGKTVIWKKEVIGDGGC